MSNFNVFDGDFEDRIGDLIGDRFKELDTRFSREDNVLDAVFTNVEESIDNAFKIVDNAFEIVDDRLAVVDYAFEVLEENMENTFDALETTIEQSVDNVTTPAPAP